MLVRGPHFEEGDGKLLLYFALTGEESENYILDSVSPEQCWLWYILRLSVIPEKEISYEG